LALILAADFVQRQEELSTANRVLAASPGVTVVATMLGGLGYSILFEGRSGGNWRVTIQAAMVVEFKKRFQARERCQWLPVALSIEQRAGHFRPLYLRL